MQGASSADYIFPTNKLCFYRTFPLAKDANIPPKHNTVKMANPLNLRGRWVGETSISPFLLREAESLPYPSNIKQMGRGKFYFLLSSSGG
jgi:hypothetical protein